MLLVDCGLSSVRAVQLDCLQHISLCVGGFTQGSTMAITMGKDSAAGVALCCSLTNHGLLSRS